MANQPPSQRVSRTEALAAYLGLGPERSLRSLMVWLQQNAAGKTVPSQRTVATWSTEDKWVAAARAHDEKVGATVSTVIAQAQGKALADELGITGVDVLREYSRIAFFNPVDFLKIGADGTVMTDLSILDRQPDLARAIQSLKVKTHQLMALDRNGDPCQAEVREVEVKFWSKLEALRQLGTHLGVLKEPAVPGGTTNINLNQQNNITVSPAQAAADEMRALEEIFGDALRQMAARPLPPPA